MESLNENTLCAVIHSLDGTPEGPRYVLVMTLGNVEQYYNELVLALPVQDSVTLKKCIALAKKIVIHKTFLQPFTCNLKPLVTSATTFFIFYK